MKRVESSEVLGQFNVPNLGLNNIAGYLKFNGKFPELRLGLNHRYYFESDENFGLITCTSPEPISLLYSIPQSGHFGIPQYDNMLLLDCPVVVIGKTISNISEKFIREIHFSFEGIIDWIEGCHLIEDRGNEYLLYQCQVEQSNVPSFTIEVVASSAFLDEATKQKRRAEVRIIFDETVDFEVAKKTAIEVNIIISMFRYSSSPIIDVQLVTEDRKACHCWFETQRERPNKGTEDIYLIDIRNLQDNPFQVYYSSGENLKQRIRHCYYYFTKPQASADDVSDIIAEIEGFGKAIFKTRKIPAEASSLEISIREYIDNMLSKYGEENKVNKKELNEIKRKIVKQRKATGDHSLKKLILLTYEYASEKDSNLEMGTEMRFGNIDFVAELGTLIRNSSFHGDIIDYSENEELEDINHYYLMLFLLGLLNLAIVKYLGLSPVRFLRSKRLFTGIPLLKQT